MSHTTNSLLSEEDQNHLLAWGHDISESGWKIGFLSVKYVDNRPEDVSKGRMRAAIAQCVGCTAGTIRSDFEHVARNVPRILIREYEELTRNHFRALIPFCKTAEEFREQIRAWRDGCQTESVASLRQWLHQRNGEPEVWKTRLHRARGLTEDLADDERAPGLLRDKARGFWVDTAEWDA
jgi:hypothetical protein